jgi:rhodanese-related sulfurtransferase
VRGLFSDRAFYYPEANLISAKLLFNPSDGAVLGLQMASKGDITRYLDTFSAVLMRRGKLSDLREFNPAFSAPLTDLEFPFHSLASYAMNLIAGGIVPLSPFDFEPEAKNSLLLDVREEHEIKGSPIKVPCLKILHLPFTQLKLRVAEIPRGLPLIALCARGSRSMNTANYLHKLGFDRITFLSGGLHFFQ